MMQIQVESISLMNRLVHTQFYHLVSKIIIKILKIHDSEQIQYLIEYLVFYVKEDKNKFEYHHLREILYN